MRRHLLVFTILLIAIVLFPDVTSSDSEKDENEFTYARIRYHMTEDAIFVREVPWHHDYPFGDEAFPTFLKEVTRIHTQSNAYQIVDIDSPDLFKYPFAYLCEPGYLELSEKDVKNFREYLERGGFVMVDDFRGPAHLSNLIYQIRKMFPNRNVIPLTLAHPVFSPFYKMESLDMRPPYGRNPVE